MYNIAIWTPINSKSGFGHFYRMLGLYESLINEDCQVCYFTNQEFLNLEKVEILSIITNDIEKITSYLIIQNIKILILDNYEVDKDKILFLNNNFVLIHFDSKFQNLQIDTIINFNPYSVNRYTLKNKETKYFIGMKYMNFRNSMKQIKKISVKRNSIFLSIGGSDVSNVTYNMIPYLPKDKFYNIILGKGCSLDYYNKVLGLLNSLKLDFELFYHPKDYFKILNKSEKVIISCSTTSYEVIFFNKPFVCINVIDNQNEITDYLKSHGICTLPKEKVNEITTIIESDRFNLPNNMKLLLESSKKLVQYIKKRSNDNEKT